MPRNNRFYSIFLILFLFILSGSCSVEKNRKILTFFFDGVPEKQSPEDPNEITTGENSVKKRKANLKSIKIISYHPDHKTRKCNKCHSRSSANFLVTEKKELCFTCHKPEKFAGPFVHGPVAVKACGACHDPHQSKNKKLLLAEGKDLCLLCHKVPLMGPTYPCKGDVCTDCHEAHVASNKFFLKQNIGDNKNNTRTSSLSTIPDSKTDTSRDNKNTGKKVLDHLKFRASDHKEKFTRVVLESRFPLEYEIIKRKKQIFFKFKNYFRTGKIDEIKNFSTVVSGFRTGKDPASVKVILKKGYKTINETDISNPFRIIVDFRINEK